MHQNYAIRKPRPFVDVQLEGVAGTISDTIAGLDWLAENVQHPAVAVLSLGVTSGQWSKVLETTVRAVVTELNVSIIVAAGNSKLNACQIAPGSPPLL